MSSTLTNANFVTDGVDMAVRNLPADVSSDARLEVEKLIDLNLVPVCSPFLVEKYGFSDPDTLKSAPLIHDESLAARASMPIWATGSPPPA